MGVRAWVVPMPMWWRRPLMAEGDFAGVVDAVVADAVVGVGGVAGGGGFGAGGVGGGGGGAVGEGAVGSRGGCSGRRRCRAGLGARRWWRAGWVGRGAIVLMVCWKRSTLPQVVGWLGRRVLLADAEAASSVSKPLRPPRPPAKRVVKTMPLSVNVDAGVPWPATAVRNVLTTVGAGDGLVGGDGQGVAGVVVEAGEDLGVGPSARR